MQGSWIEPVCSQSNHSTTWFTATLEHCDTEKTLLKSAPCCRTNPPIDRRLPVPDYAVLSASSIHRRVYWESCICSLTPITNLNINLSSTLQVHILGRDDRWYQSHMTGEANSTASSQQSPPLSGCWFICASQKLKIGMDGKGFNHQRPLLELAPTLLLKFIWKPQQFHTCTHWELVATEAVEHFQSTAELPLSKALPPKLSKTGRFCSV